MAPRARRLLWAVPSMVWAVYDLWRLSGAASARLESVAAVGTSNGTTPSIDIVVPARDEADFLSGCLDALGQLRDVVVVDDGSVDGTAAAARDRGATVIDAGPRPPGWAGKVWALQRGFESTSSEWFAWVDADVRTAADTVEGLAAAAARAGVPAACLLGHQQGWLEFDAGLLVTRRACDVRAVNAGRSTYLVGQCAVVRRDALAAVGAFAAVKGSVVEDVDIGERLGRHLLVNAVDRMVVARRPGRLWASWRKNMWRTHGGKRGLVLEAIHLPAVACLPWLAGPGAGLAVWGLVAAGRLGARLSAGRSWVASAAQAMIWPVADAILLTIFAESIRAHDLPPITDAVETTQPALARS